MAFRTLHVTEQKTFENTAKGTHCDGDGDVDHAERKLEPLTGITLGGVSSNEGQDTSDTNTSRNQQENTTQERHVAEIACDASIGLACETDSKRRDRWGDLRTGGHEIRDSVSNGGDKGHAQPLAGVGVEDNVDGC